MKTRARKGQVGQKRDKHGAEVRRGAEGRIEMIEFCEYEANPLAPMIHVTRIGGIYRMGGLIKVTFASDVPSAAGLIRTIERASLLWEVRDVVSANDQFDWAFKEWHKGTIGTTVPDDGGGRRPRTQ